MLRQIWANMSRGGRLFLLVLGLAALLPFCLEKAQAQVQPIPIIQAKGKTITVFDAISGADTTSSVYDVSGYAGVQMVAVSTCTGSGTATVFTQTSNSATGTFRNVITGHAQIRVDSSNSVFGYTAVGLLSFVRFNVVLTAGCSSFTLYMTPVPIASASVNIGPILEASELLPTSRYPLMGGGVDALNLTVTQLFDTSGRQISVGAGADGAAVAGNPNLIAGTDGTNAQTLSVDSSGRLFVSIAGASTSAAYGEVAVATTATAVPTTILTGRRSIFIQNNGPNEIVCATNSSVSLTNGITLAANGGNVTLDCGSTCAMNCIAQTANQVSGAATNFIELN